MSDAAEWRGFAKLCRRVLDALDWDALGEIYFHWDGEESWRERIPHVVDMGEMLAHKLLERVPRGGSSLWVGAGVAELPVMLAETMMRGRTVVAANLRAAECDLLNAGLRAAAPEAKFQYVTADAREVEAGRTFDHLGCISVFTDPESWPTLSDVAYGRIAPVQLDVEQFVAERERARELAAALFARLSRPGWITTSAEEASWFLEPAVATGVSYDASEDLVETAVVGDPVGFLRIG